MRLFRPLQRKLLRDTLQMRGQMIAIVLIVASAVATFIAMRGGHDALVAGRDSFYQSHRFAQVFARLKRAPETVAPAIANLSGVAAVETRVVREVTLDVPGLEEPAVGRLVSVPDGRTGRLNLVYIRSGRPAAAGAENEAVLSETFAARNNLRPGSSFGALINGRWKTLKVVGIGLSPEYVNEVRAGSSFPDYQRFGILWMSRKALGSAFDMEGAFNDVTLSLAPGGDERAVIAGVDRILARYGGFGAYGRDEQVSHVFLRDEIQQDAVSAKWIPGIFLGVAAFLINMVLSRLVAAQRDQIAILKAFGYSNRPIALHYLGFSMMAVIGGSALGVPAGVWLSRELAELYESFFHFPDLQAPLNAAAIMTAVLISVGAAVLAALGAVQRAVKLPPAEGMREPTPGKFSAGILEQTVLRRFLLPGSRMIVRSIVRRPLRAGLSVLGVALAVMILVLGFFSVDSLDAMMDIQFRLAQQDDITVSFISERPASILYELRRMTGVLRVEPMRIVPVRLRSGHRSRQIALIGLDPDHRLRRLVDAERNELALPPVGVVLSAKLAEILGVRQGDVVRAEMLEGERITAELRVAATLDELAGTSAYVDRRHLDRILGDAPTVNAAMLAVEPSSSAALNARLKRTPAVGSADFREATLATFRDIVAQSIRVSGSFLIFFAALIAFGMVYNGLRISLSERARDLASLRVLGFSRGEVTAMLLGEQVILTALAIPLGCILGYLVSAWIVQAFDSELYRLPLVISMRTYAKSFLITAGAAAFSSLVARQKIRTLNLVEVLKARE